MRRVVTIANQNGEKKGPGASAVILLFLFFLLWLLEVVVIATLGQFLIVYIFVEEIIDLFNVRIRSDLSELVDRNIKAAQLLMNFGLWFVAFVLLFHSIEFTTL